MPPARAQAPYNSGLTPTEIRNFNAYLNNHPKTGRKNWLRIPRSSKIPISTVPILAWRASSRVIPAFRFGIETCDPQGQPVLAKSIRWRAPARVICVLEVFFSKVLSSIA